MSGAERTCPQCGGAGIIADETGAHIVEAKVEELRSCCRDSGIPVSVTGTVTESEAARLLDRAPPTLANWRYGDAPIPFRKVNGRVRYALSDLAAWMLENEI